MADTSMTSKPHFSQDFQHPTLDNFSQGHPLKSGLRLTPNGALTPEINSGRSVGFWALTDMNAD
jgi:hypothetical protein